MSRLEELISELCPDGVDFKQLGEISEIFIGSFVKKTEQDKTYQYPVYNGGIEPTGYYYKHNSKKNSIAISARGANCGFVNYLSVDFWAGNSCFVLKDLPNDIDSKYLFYYLKSNEQKIFDLRQTSGIPAINQVKISGFVVPVPPLSVQKEIVRILDTFTELEAQLDAELEAREKQYAYYRDALLDFNPDKPRIGSKHSRLNKLIETLCPDGVEIVPLYKVSRIERGQRITKSKLSLTAKYPVISGGINPMGFLDYYNRDENTITVAQYGTAGFVNLQKQKFWANDVCYTIQVGPRLLNKYLYYFLKSRQDLIYSMKIDAVPAHLPLQRLESLTISIPPLDVQKEIVRILDQFDTLVNDIKQGLPAEISARRKQYEYYRDKLLTFKEKQP